jgi:hypothetical protein
MPAQMLPSAPSALLLSMGGSAVNHLALAHRRRGAAAARAAGAPASPLRDGGRAGNDETADEPASGHSSLPPTQMQRVRRASVAVASAFQGLSRLASNAAHAAASSGHAGDRAASES